MSDDDRSRGRAAQEPPMGAVDPAGARASVTFATSGVGTGRPSAGTPRPGTIVLRSPPEDLDPKYRLSPGPMLLALGLCLIGFIDIAVQLYEFKFDGIGPYIHGVPSRVLFVFGMTLVASPLVLAIFRRTTTLFILPSIALVFLLYPFFIPYFGVPSGQDAVFNFQFAYSLLQSGHWVPGSGVTLQAISYSYYPGSGVFNAEFSAFTGIPLTQTFEWGEPLLRLLMLPPLIYSVGARYFGPRVGVVGVMIFLATPSILFNYPVQSEFAIPFFALTLVLLGYVIVPVPGSPTAIVGAAALFAGFVVISHHFSSYSLAAWLGCAGVLWVAFRSFETPQTRRAGVVIGAYFAFLVGFTLWISLPNFLANITSLEVVIKSLENPFALSVSTATSVGSSFPEYELVWSYLAYLVLILLSLLTLRRWLKTERRRFMNPNLLIAIFGVVLSLPLLVTAFSFVAERVMEYGELFMAPAVAWWITQQLAPPSARTSAPRRAPNASGAAAAPARRIPPTARPRILATAGVLLLVVLIFTGGSLVPYSTRDQFALSDAISTESPLNLDQNSYALGIWALTHLTPSTYVWGDNLVMLVFGGFARFNMQYNQYALYNGTSIPLSVWVFVTVGSYIVVDKYMSTTTPQFPGPSYSQPTAPLTEPELAKFNNPAFFDLVYQDSTFTIYEVTAVL